MSTTTSFALVHLVSGEDIIGEIRESMDSLIIQYPVRPQVHIDPAAQTMRIGIVGLHPWEQEKTDSTIQVHRQHVLYTRPLPTQMENAYLQYRSGLVMGASVGEPSLASLLKG